MKNIVFMFGGKRLEVDLEKDFAAYLLADLSSNKIELDKENEIGKLLGLYLSTLHREHNREKQIKILTNQIESSNK